MIRKEYPWLGGGEAVVRVGKATRDLLEFLMELKGKGRLVTEFPAAPASIAYHLPCHLKVQNIGFKSRDLLALTGAKVTMVEKCSGHDGTWAMKAEYFGESMKVGQKLFDGLAAAAADVVVSDCPLAGVQIRQGMGIPVLTLSRLRTPRAAGRVSLQDIPMKKVELSDVKNLHEYELIRGDWRKSVIVRRSGASSRSVDALVFENRRRSWRRSRRCAGPRESRSRKRCSRRSTSTTSFSPTPARSPRRSSSRSPRKPGSSRSSTG
jgi:hypothetical protein